MTRWRAVVPIKLGVDAKSRLAGLLSPSERMALGVRMATHVLRELEVTGRIDEITVLSPRRPVWWAGAWAADIGRGLNAELIAWRARRGVLPVLFIHADLPLVTSTEIADLLDAAEASGIALATDRAGQGSNALAIADGRAVVFRFGPGSRALHVAQVPEMPVLTSPGLTADLDTPDDAFFIAAQGFALQLPRRQAGPHRAA